MEMKENRMEVSEGPPPPSTTPPGMKLSDEAVLAGIGYQQELKRDWNLIQNFGVSFSIISVITGITTLFSTGLNVGGPAVMTWGWIIVSFMTTLVGLSMAEIVSAIPTSGGPYSWSSILSKPNKSALSAWITGWFNLVGQISVTTGINYGCANLISTTIEIISTLENQNQDNYNYVSNPFKIILIFIGILISHGLLNTFSNRCTIYNNKKNILILLNYSSIFLHSFGIATLIITLLIKLSLSKFNHDFQTTNFVFFTFFDGTGGWSQRASPAYVAVCGILFAQYTITGFDASAHMSEETKNARWTAAIGVISSIIVSSIFGFVVLISLLYCIQDIETTLRSKQPVFEILNQVFGLIGAKISISLIIISIWHCGLFSLTSNSRMLFAFARDGALPTKIFAIVNPKFGCPVNTVWLSVFLAFLLALPSLGSSVAFTAATSIATIGLYISYGLPILFSLIWDERFIKGPFYLKSFSKPIRIISCLWIVSISIFFCLPTATPITKENLNYTPVVLGVVIVWIVLSWIFWARQNFKGPKK